jgi:hypothetical protein
MRIDCTRFQDMVDELALDLLTGNDRADALGHLDECHACRGDVVSLTDAADELLLLAPAAAPDPGFEGRVLARLEIPPQRHIAADAPRSRRRRVATGLAASAAAVVLVLAALSLRSGRPAPSSVAGSMVSGPGTVVGQVVVRGDQPAVVSMRLPGWGALVRSYVSPAPEGYVLDVRLRDGSHRVATLATPHDGRWRVALTVRARDVDSVSIEDGQGRAWCSARLT